MSVESENQPVPVVRATWVTRMGRLRVGTLILIRWIAIGGQAITLLGVRYGLEFDLPLLPCLAAVTASAASNVWLAARHDRQTRLSDREAVMVLGFDIVQLTVLLFLTGGLLNPFATLILAPVTVSATILSRTATAILVTLVFASITALALWHAPLPWEPNGLILPLLYNAGIWAALSVAALFIAAYVWSVAEEARRMSEALAEARQALAREQRFAALGGLAAAAAHELGSPLATIAVVARELSRSAPPGSAMAEDVELLLSQSDRCREILAELSRRPEATGGPPFEQLLLSALVEAAVEPHRTGTLALDLEAHGADESPEPQVARSPEILLSLGTLVQNAMQFARGRVEVVVSWSHEMAAVAIRDDGPGFESDILAALGEPYISSRGGGGKSSRRQGRKQMGQKHMGLGIFIAKTLLERTGASLSFGNRGGAEVVIRWPRTMLGALEQSGSAHEPVGKR